MCPFLKSQYDDQASKFLQLQQLCIRPLVTFCEQRMPAPVHVAPHTTVWTWEGTIQLVQCLLWSHGSSVWRQDLFRSSLRDGVTGSKFPRACQRTLAAAASRTFSGLVDMLMRTIAHSTVASPKLAMLRRSSPPVLSSYVSTRVFTQSIEKGPGSDAEISFRTS